MIKILAVLLVPVFWVMLKDPNPNSRETMWDFMKETWKA